jgi:hypothetical protein
VDFFLLLPFAQVALWITKARQQQRRIAILARYLSGHDIEKNIETLSQGYSRALSESDPARSARRTGRGAEALHPRPRDPAARWRRCAGAAGRPEVDRGRFLLQGRCTSSFAAESGG